MSKDSTRLKTKRLHTLHSCFSHLIKQELRQSSRLSCSTNKVLNLPKMKNTNGNKEKIEIKNPHTLLASKEWKDDGWSAKIQKEDGGTLRRSPHSREEVEEWDEARKKEEKGLRDQNDKKKPSNLWPGKPYMAVLCLSARFLQYCATIHYLQYFNYSTTNNSKTQGHSHGYVQPPYGRVPLSHGHVSPCVPFCQFTIVPCYNTFTTIPLLQYFSYNMQNTRKTHERVTARVAPGNVTWPHTRACKY